MAIHWQVKFKSLRANELYTVNIYDDNYSGQPVQLIGAADPFSTQEDYDDDMFTPVRRQSGYIRIVDTGRDATDTVNVNWRSIIPTTDTDRPVTLTDSNGNVRWIGFMQAQNFGAALYENPQEREFPIQCPLSVVSREDIPIANTEIQNFAYLLKTIIDFVPSISRPTEIVVQGGSDAREWLLKRMDWQNFVDFDENFTPKSKWDMGSILDDMCTFWGWTARMHEQSLILTCIDDSAEPNALVLSYSDLSDLAGGSSTSAGSVETMTSGVTIGDIFATTNNHDYQNRGPNTAEVDADCNPYGDTLYQSFPNTVARQMQNGGWQGYTQYGDISVNYTNDILTFNDEFMSASAVSGNGSFNLAIYSKDNQPADKKNVVRILKSYNGSPFVTLESRYEHMFDGFMQFKCKIYQHGEQYQESRGIYNKTMRMAVGIGSSIYNAQWYDGNNGWGSTKTIFQCLLGYEDGLLHFFSGVLTWDVLSIGYYFLTGKLFIEFYGSEDLTEYDGQRLFDIEGLSIEYRRAEVDFDYTLIDRKSSNHYEAKNTNMIHEEWSEDSIYASDNNNAFGFGTLINPNNVPLTTVNYGASAERPEQHLCNRIVSYWATSKRKITCELLANDGTSDTVADTISPRNTASIDGSTMYPISISRNWRDDVVMLSLMEM